MITSVHTSAPLITPRELDILLLLSEGLTEKEMAAQLFVSTHTVHSHKKKLLQKFDARNCVHLAVKAVRMGIV